MGERGEFPGENLRYQPAFQPKAKTAKIAPNRLLVKLTAAVSLPGQILSVLRRVKNKVPYS
jgi:hypothetical protein